MYMHEKEKKNEDDSVKIKEIAQSQTLNPRNSSQNFEEKVELAR